MMGVTAVGAVLAEVGQGFALCLAVAALSDLVLRHWSHLASRAPATGGRDEAASRTPGTGAPGAPDGTTDVPGARGRRAAQVRALMVVSLGRLAADGVGLVLVFFLLAEVWALVGGALGLVSWRALGLAVALRRLPDRSRSAGPHEEAVS
ncbi:MAG: hypothetical protein QME93_05835 [Bacillota bacterium]|nr:hypothetical protein [Bacillota bacterium]MDI7249574.1 hypothetical protein [Bacillota bacterium]